MTGLSQTVKNPLQQLNFIYKLLIINYNDSVKFEVVQPWLSR